MSSDTADVPSKDDMLKERCGKSEHTCCEMSGVDIISLEPETLRQWTKVSSVERLERPGFSRKGFGHTSQVDVDESSNSSEL
jgi:hypothetical protein